MSGMEVESAEDVFQVVKQNPELRDGFQAMTLDLGLEIKTPQDAVEAVSLASRIFYDAYQKAGGEKLRFLDAIGQEVGARSGKDNLPAPVRHADAGSAGGTAGAGRAGEGAKVGDGTDASSRVVFDKSGNGAKVEVRNRAKTDKPGPKLIYDHEGTTTAQTSSGGIESPSNPANALRAIGHDGGGNARAASEKLAEFAAESWGEKMETNSTAKRAKRAKQTRISLITTDSESIRANPCQVWFPICVYPGLCGKKLGDLGDLAVKF